MRKDKGYEFIKCHSCGELMDVSKAALVFEQNSEKNIIKNNCSNCGSISQLVISMVFGLTSIENINKSKLLKTR